MTSFEPALTVCRADGDRQMQIAPSVERHGAARELRHAGFDGSVITLYIRGVSIETTQTGLHSRLVLEEAAPVTLNHDEYAADTSPLRCFGTEACAQALDQSSP